MIIKQLTVFLQNKSGRLEDLTDILAKNNINISALNVAETEEYGIMRMIVSDHEKALQALKAAEFTVKTTDVVSIECPDIPGALHETLKTLTNNGIDVSYMYGYSNGGMARLIMKITNPEKAMEIIENNL
ncbi:MAG: ACT domain-containing protein [Peptostreptococcaceae bacterium]|nr:ACT domain-containing protein [Peptostreptococcaceae bacterium]